MITNHLYKVTLYIPKFIKKMIIRNTVQ